MENYLSVEKAVSSYLHEAISTKAISTNFFYYLDAIQEKNRGDSLRGDSFVEIAFSGAWRNVDKSG